jgi:hypothetical protein
MEEALRCDYGELVESLAGAPRLRQSEKEDGARWAGGVFSPQYGASMEIVCRLHRL